MSLLQRIWQHLLGRSVDPQTAFHSQFQVLTRKWFEVVSSKGKPRGLNWLGFERVGDPLFVREKSKLLALVQLEVQFEPIAGGELAEVAQAREPRTVTAIFAFRQGKWDTDGQALFNLTPTDLVAREPTRYRRV